MSSQLLVFIIFLCLPGLISSQLDDIEEDNCISNACYPSTGDLLVGRGRKLYASSICGEKGPQRYCTISKLDGRSCTYCDSRSISPKIYQHLPEFMEIDFNEKKQSWWQSENGQENVYLQLDFDAQFHVTHVIMKWKSFRPAAMLIEKSFDYGQSWNVSRYYAKSCRLSFPGVPTRPTRDISIPYCTPKYSKLEPSTGGEVVYKALRGNENAADVKTQNLLRVTNLRIKFTKLNTLGDDIIDNSLESNLNYYYAVDWITIRGSCSCYGHARHCLPGPGEDSGVSGMVHRICNCTHNTKGVNCEECKDLYNDHPWRPAEQGNPNECRKCECNGHADKCKFDVAVWEASGQTSGGVCIDCKHNTIGTKCEKCKPLHYKDPSLPMSDPNVCKTCDCDPSGSVGLGECQMEEDPVLNLRAGQCICKKNVYGARCDRCKNGYFNLRKENLDGCEACACDINGAIGSSCDTITGKCQCKRFVEGDKCDKCFDEYWGLASSTGCKPCDCDPGGAYSNQCDPVSGQCSCRPGIEGMKCDRVIPGYYYALSDNLKYEAEDARGIGLTKIRLLERFNNTPVVWSDVGSMKITEGNAVEFTVTNIPITGNYKILMRVHPRTLAFWEEVKVTITRADGQRTVNGVCGNSLSFNGYSVFITMESFQQTKLLDDMVCLEKGVHYFLRVDFNRHQGRDDHINLDSIVLIPDMSSVDVFQGGRGQLRFNDFINYRCEQSNLLARYPRLKVNEVCKKLHFSGSAVIYDGAILCDCNEIGTVKNVSGIYTCDNAGGQCPCRINVIGRTCQKCAPGTYNFGPNGCSPCECDLRGSHDNLCDVVTGQCKCNGLGIGRKCNECPEGEWGFPTCRPCECNGHASRCDPVTGVCIDCAHNTAGVNCELCKAGYYGNATKGTSTDCQKCQCPGGSSENEFSPTCRVDGSTIPPSFVCDKCQPGYEGNQCESCSNGYYGNPLLPGGKCEKCNCSGNINATLSGGCDKKTGECFGCLYNTAGYYCDVCKPGYYGNAKNQTCQACNCSEIGTVLNSGSCDSLTGQCQCKPNVVGLSCDRCAQDYWDLNSGTGCKACKCCKDGSTTTQCDEASGVCSCRGDFGGPNCCHCEDGFWGVPPGQCQPCNCNPIGVTQSQCDRKTGKCYCKPGITGIKCNKCELETTRLFPECKACHDCYYSWDKIISELEDFARRLNRTIRKDGDDAIVSVDYQKEIDALKEILRKIEYILGNKTTFLSHVENIQNGMDKYEKKIVEMMKIIEELRENLNVTRLRTNNANIEIEKLWKNYRKLKVLFDGHLDELTTTIEAPKADDALNITNHYYRISNKTLDDAKDVRKIVDESAMKREEFKRKTSEYETTNRKILEKLEDFRREYGDLNEIIGLINAKLCGSNSSLCGGCTITGCDGCGDNEGCDGAVPLSRIALEKAKLAEDALRLKEEKANATMAEIIEAQRKVDNAMNEAKIALELAKSIELQTFNNTVVVGGLIEEIYIYLNRSAILDTDEIRRIGEFVLGRKLNISEEGVIMLGERIKEAVRKLTGIDQILEDTERDFAMIEDLKQQAIQANISATVASQTAKNITKWLKMVDVIQNGWKTSLNKTKDKLDYINLKLLEIEGLINKTMNRSFESVRITNEASKRLGPLDMKFSENEKSLLNSEKDINETAKLASDTKTNSNKVKNLSEQVNEQFNETLNDTLKFHQRAKKAFDSATTIKLSLINTLRRLQSYYIQRNDLDDVIEKLKILESKVTEKFCQIKLDSKRLSECQNQGQDVRSTNTMEGYCDQLEKEN